MHEVSELTGVPVNTLRRWRRDKTGPRSGTLGGRVVYRRSDLEKWVDDQLAEAAG